MKSFKTKRASGAMQGPLANEQGAILVIALLALVVLSVLGLAFITISKTESDISYNDRDSGKALYVADAGLERFKRDLRYQVTYPGTDTTWRYVASPAPSGDGTLEDTTGVKVKSTAPVKRYYDLSSPLGTTFLNLTAYQQSGLNGGNYALKVKKDTDDGLIVQSAGTMGTRVARTVEAKYEPKSLSVWDNAIFAGSGAAGAFIQGCAKIAGSVHILGNGLTSTDTAIELSGDATIMNQYSGISSTLDAALAQNALAIAALPGKLKAEYRCKKGMTVINSGSAGAGESTCNIKGVYTNDGFSGSHPGNVYSDNGKNMKYDLPSDLSIPFPLPDTANPPLSTALNITASLPVSGGDRMLDSATPSFALSDANGNTITWQQGVPAGHSGTLSLTGVVKVTGNLHLAKKNNNLLFSGKGTLYVTGDVNIHECLLPATASSFPTTNAIGVISGGSIDIATGGGESNARITGAFYAQNTIRSNKQTQTAGTWVSQNFDLGNQVPRIYQVPLLAKNLPPGMPGADPYFFIKTVYWREVTN